ncbi:hypothetical protein LCGC14_0441800 [marine sediment metagenome]|uniref:Uncharacterized protein n=1 Tax=marine sediment metagenome TaxID=412755 RepID=A0A0F9V739_9ZZZZ
MRNHKEFFWVAMLCSLIGGILLGRGYSRDAIHFFILAAISLTLKWIFIAVDEKEAKRNGNIN